MGSPEGGLLSQWLVHHAVCGWELACGPGGVRGLHSQSCPWIRPQPGSGESRPEKSAEGPRVGEQKGKSKEGGGGRRREEREEGEGRRGRRERGRGGRERGREGGGEEGRERAQRRRGEAGAERQSENHRSPCQQ